MRLSIRNKLILAISILMIVLFSVAAYLFITEKKKEIADDIYVNALAFARLTASNVVSNYDLYLTQNSFVYFNRAMRSLFEENDDVGAIQVVSYKGDIFYDSEKDVDEKYVGERRTISEQNLLDQIQSENISLKTLDGRVYFVKLGLEGALTYVDLKENSIASLKEGELLDYLVVPASERYSVIYKLDYHNLQERVGRMTQRIIYLAIFGIMLGMFLSFAMSTRVTRPVHQLEKGVKEIAKGNFKAQVDIKTSDEIGFLGQAFNKMAQDLEKSVEAKVYKERVTRELELAAQIQDQLIPDQSQIPKMAGIDLAAGLIPAEEIGGDIYDFLRVGENNLIMYLGDVTGHGVPAGIISSISSALFYGYSIEADLKKILLDVNRVLKAKTMPTMFLTLCLMLWDAQNKKFFYSSAGHEKILHYCAGTKKAEYKTAGGVALGMLANVSRHITVQEIDFRIGDFLIIYSDGIPECWRSEKELYGFERLQSAMERFADLGSPEAVMKAILADVKNFAAGYKQMDDITIMVVKRV